MDDFDDRRPLDSDADNLPGASVVPADMLLPLLVDAAAALRSLAPLLLPCRVLAYRDSLPAGLGGAYAPLVGGGNSAYIGVLADRSSALRIARRLTLDSEELDELKVRAAMCRVARRLAHGLKRRLRSTQPVAVTEPVFVSGIIQPSGDHDLRAAEVVLGTVRATLVIVARGDATSSASKQSNQDSADAGGLDGKRG